MKNDDDLLKRFENAIELGKEGKVDSFDLWLKKQDINSDRLNSEKFSQYIIEHPEKIVNRIAEFEEIANYIGYFFENRNNLYHLVLYGIDGVGKSIVFQVLNQLILKLKSEIKVESLNAAEFTILEDDGFTRFYHYYEKIQENNPDILLVDSCDKDKNIEESLRKISMFMNSGLIISIWDPLSWNYHKNSIQDYLATTKEINILPFDFDESKILLDTFLSFISEKNKNLKEELYSKIWMFSKGIPMILFNLYLISLQEAFAIKLDTLNEKSIIEAAKRLNLFKIENKLNKITEIQYLILKKMSLHIDERGIRPIFLAEELNKDQATIAYHLNTLITLKITKKEKIGKFTFYKIPKNLKPIIQNRITRESEFFD